MVRKTASGLSFMFIDISPNKHATRESILVTLSIPLKYPILGYCKRREY